jgi:hypothetical protein
MTALYSVLKAVWCPVHFMITFQATASLYYCKQNAKQITNHARYNEAEDTVTEVLKFSWKFIANLISALEC